jgi:alkanesulfonate monooxygenase SsuD/methylene tetrahydromethanopterin reductase-like flavin-dependent oxidoreductase (luciferase family)
MNDTSNRCFQEHSMKFGINLPPFGDYGDPLKLAQMAHEAEEAGWDGFFIWDHIMFDPTFHPIPDTWVALAVIATHTRRMRIGTLVTPIARRRPWKLARETVSVDRLSNGRLTLGIGLGDPVQWDYGFFGEETDAKIRAQKLDEGLDILTGLWSGKPFSYSGQHFKLNEVTFRPPPPQTPRIPIWVGGNWDKRAPQRRAARWDGYNPLRWGGTLTPDDWREMMGYINSHRTSSAPFDWVHTGAIQDADRADARSLIQPYADAGITWWIDSASPFDFGADWEKPLTPEWTALMDRRIRQGPPRFE